MVDSKNGEFVELVLLDYANAFDHVDPNILLVTLHILNIPDCLLRWIEAFMSDKHHRVKIGQNASDWLEFWGPVSQCTSLGVMCFYNNTIGKPHECVEQLNVSA